MRKLCVALLVVLLVVPLAAAQAPSPTPTGKGVNFYSLEKEIAMGREAAAQLDAVLPIVREPKLDAYLNQIGGELARHAPYAGFPYGFTVFDDRKPVHVPHVPAFPAGYPKDIVSEPLAVAGGPVFLPLSFFSRAASEDELAAVLAHAIAHVALRHVTRDATRSELVSRAADGLPKAADAPVPVVTMGMMTLERALEREADFLAAQILAKSGYDPAALTAWLRKLPQPTRGGGQFSTMPPPERRIAGLASHPFTVESPRAPTGEFEAMRKLAAGLE